MHSKVVVFPLVLEKHVLVRPVRCHELSIHIDLSNQLLSAAELNGLVHGEDFVKGLPGWHLLEYLLQIELGRVFDWVCVGGNWLEAKFPGENRVLLLSSVLGVHRKVRKAHRPCEISLDCEMGQARKNARCHGRLNVIREAVLEEVEALLAIQAELGDDVGRVDAVAKELDADTRRHMLSLSVNLRRRAQANVACVSAAAEHSSVRVVSKTYPSRLGHITDAVEGLLSAVKLITLLVESSSRFDLEVLSRVPVATLLVARDLLPDDIVLFGPR